MPEPTIILGSLSDEELKKSIDKLVEHVDQANKKMVSGFDSTIEQMKKKLAELKSESIQIGNIEGGKVNGSKTSAQSTIKKETEEVKEKTVAYDKLNDTIQKAKKTETDAMQPKNARDSYHAFLQGFNQRAAQLAEQIKNAEAMLQRTINSKVDDFTAKINKAKTQLYDLNTQLVKANNEQIRTGNHSTFQPTINRVKQAMDYTIIQIEDLKKRMSEIPQSMDVQALQAKIASLRAEYDKAAHAMDKITESGTKATTASTQQNEQAKQLTTTLAQEETSMQKITQEAKTYSSTIKQAADIIRNSQAFNSPKGYVNSAGVFSIFAENYAREGEKAKSVEQQLVELVQKRQISEQDILDLVQREAVEKQKVANVDARKRYVHPNTEVIEYDNLTTAVSRLLNINELEFIQVRNLDGTYNLLTAQLKMLNDAYNELTASERKSADGMDIADQIQRVNRELQKLQNQKNAPSSLQNALGLPEKSLDDISYKIRQLTTYRNNLDASTATGQQEIRQVSAAISDLQKRQDKLLGSTKGLINGNNTLTRSFNYMKNRLAFMFTVGGTTQFVKQLTEVRGEYEMTERALGVLIGSAERGSQVFQELSRQALVSPYTLIELSNAAKQLTAYEVAARDVVDVTRRLADISAAVGAPIERLTYALGQIKAYNYLNSRDARIFANAGIPLVKQLSEYYSQLEGRLVSVGDVYDRIKKKAVGYNDVMGVLTKMTDESGRFFNYQEKVADTLKVQLANLTLAWNNMLNEIGKAQSGLLTGSIKGLKNLFLQWKSLSRGMNNVLITYGLLKGVQSIFLIFAKKINNEKVREIFLNEKLNASYKQLGSTMKTVTLSKGTWLTAALLLIESIAAKSIRATREIRAFNKAISDSAKESSKNLQDFLNETIMVSTRQQAANKKLAPNDADKAWTAIREEIENSSAASNIFIPQLMQIEDVNKRVTQAFAVADKIREAQDALSDLYDEMDVADAPAWYRFLFGDKNSSVAQALEKFETLKRRKDESPKVPYAVTKAGEVAYNHIADFVADAANLIKENLGSEGIKDATKVTEAWAQILQGFYKQYPDLSKSARNDFEYWTNELFGKEFEDVFDRGALAQKKFFDILRKNSSSAFANINDNFISEQGGLTSAQQDAISKAAEQLGTQWSKLFWQSVNDSNGRLDSKKLERAIIAAFGVTDRDFIQKDFDKLFLNGKSDIDKGLYTSLRMNSDESDLEWEKRLADREKDLTEQIEQKNYALQQYNNLSKESKALRRKELEQMEQEKEAVAKVQKAFGLRNQAQLDDAKNIKENANELSNAIKTEVEVVTNMRKRYQEYINKGVDSTKAMDLVAKEYNNTLNNVNNTLRKFGITTLSNKTLAKKSTQEIIDFYTKQLKQVKSTIGVNNLFSYDAIASEIDAVSGVSNKLIEYTKKFEGLKKFAYDDATGEILREGQKPKGTVTIGYGHSALAPTIKEKPIAIGVEMTEEEARRILSEDYAMIKKYADKVISQGFEGLKDMTASQYDALLDFTYQYGQGGLKKLLTKAGDDAQSIAEALYDPSKVGLNRDAAQESRRAWRRDVFKGEQITVDSIIKQVNALTKDGKNEEALEVLEKGLATLGVELVSEDFDNRLTNLNALISDLKEAYDLGKEMRANPALANVFADMMGISSEELSDIPQSFESLVEKIQGILVSAWAFDENAQKIPNIMDVLNITSLEKFIADNKIGDGLADILRNAVKMLNDVRMNEAKDLTDSWNQLLEKYAEYEYKRTEIANTAERERAIARANNADKAIFDAIDTKERQDLANLDFEQFQQANTWLTATGDLATLTDGALRELIAALEEYKDKAKDLDPKSIKSINSALRKMHSQLRKGNPFTAIAEAIQDAKDRQEDFSAEMMETQEEFNELYAKMMSGNYTDKDLQRFDELGQKLVALKKILDETSKVSPTAIVDGVNDAIGVARTATNEFKELANAIGGDGMTEAAENIEHTMNILESAGQGAQIGASVGGGWGALIGAVAGGLKGLVVEFMDEWTGNAGISRAITKTQRQLTRLGQTYDKLAWQAEQAYGVMTTGANAVIRSNKEMQLAELEHQLELEKSRKAKNQDEDEILRLEGEVASLRREVDDTSSSIINDLLGISSAGSQIESLVQVMIDAFRNGEDAMEAFGEKWDEMIDNMILKLMVSQIISDDWDKIMETLKAKEKEMQDTAANEKAALEAMTEEQWSKKWAQEKGFQYYMKMGENIVLTKRGEREWAKYGESYKQRILANADENIKATSEAYTEWSIEYLSTTGKKIIYNDVQALKEALGKYYDFGDKATSDLSQLQQGIQGITETTAGALEAYMNGISQQVYLHTDIMLRIEEAVKGLEANSDLGINGQILLQLQESHKIQTAIHGMLEGWSSDNGRSVRVEMLN